jgi:uncharacterized protein
MKQCVCYVRENAKKNKLRVNIESGLNGIMSQSVVDWIVRHIDGATLSLDGIPEVQNLQRPLANGGHSFPLVAATLRRLDQHHFNYAIRMTVTQKMVANLCESVQFIVDRFRVKSIQVEPVFLFGRALDRSLEPVDVDMFVEQFRAAAIIADNKGVHLKYSGARFGTKTTAFCKAVTGDAFGVTPEGDVSSCYEVTDVNDPRSSLFFIGNFDRAHEAFVFEKEKIERLRSLTVEHKACCSKCFCKWHCAGDCPAKLAAMGDAWQPDLQSRCRITMDLTKDQIKKML